MRIAIVINTSWNIFNFRLSLAEAIKNEGHEIIAIAPEDDYSKKLEEFGFEYFPIKMENKGTNPIKELALVWSFYKTYKKAKVDIVLHYTVKPNIYGTIAAKLLGIKSINNVSGLGTLFIREGFTTKIASHLYRYAFKFASCIFFQNPDDRQEFLDRKLVTLPKTDLLPGSGVKLSEYHAQPYQRSTPFKFLMISRLIYDKGIIEFLQAAKELKPLINAEFQICGKVEPDAGLGLSQNDIDKWINEGTITYLGHIDNVPKAIQQADCVVLPSYREGTPKSLLEGAALQKPLIATDAPGCREVVIHNHNGLLCKVKDTTSLKNTLLTMFNSDDETLNTWALNSRKLVESKFDDKFVIEKYLNYINSNH